MIREGVRDVSARRDGEGRTSEPQSGLGSREEPEAPREELPEWLAKELFRIFV